MLGGETRRGTLAMLGGGALFVRGLRARGRLRSVLQAAAGIALVAYGVRQRLSGGESRDGGQGGFDDGPGGPGDTVEEAGGPTEAIRHESQSGTNPRDVDADPNVETQTAPDEGSIQFTTDQDETASPKPRDDGGDEGDPRMAESGTGQDEADTEIDISEAHVADEASEAVGPDPEQAYPAQVEDTEPDASPEADASHVEADEPATDASERDSDSASGGDESDDESEPNRSDDSESTPNEPGTSEGTTVSTDERYEGERGEDGTVEDTDR